MSRIDPLGIYGLWVRDVTRFVRSPSRILGTAAMPLLFLVFLGIGLENVDLPGLPSDVDYLAFLVPGMVAFAVLFGASVAGLSILTDRDVGFLREILVAPVSRTSIVLGRIAGGSTTALLQALLILACSIPLGFRVRNPLALPLAVGVVVLIAVTFVGLGIAVASQFSDSEGFGLLMQFVIFPILFLSGALFPVQSLPEPVQLLTYLNPLTYGVDALRELLVGSGALPLWVDLLALVVSGVAMVAAGAALFSRVEAV